MKNLIVLLFIIVTISFNLSCKKNKASNQKLPDVTEEGKNTVGFMVDNEVWVPYYTCKLSGDPCAEMQVDYDDTKKYLSLGITRESNGVQTSLTISGSTISTLGNKIDSIGSTYIDGSNTSSRGIYFIILPGSSFNITKVDVTNKIISGNFNLLLSEHLPDGNTKELKNGRFDLKFSVCNCTH